MFKITKVVTDLSNEKYHSVGTEIISSSYLKGIYKHSIKRAKIPMESNDALVFGTQFHDTYVSWEFKDFKINTQ